MTSQPSIGIGGSVGGNIISGNVNGDVSSVVHGDVSGAISQLPESTEPNRPGLKELLTQLAEAIAQEPSLPDEDKQEALEQIKILAEAGPHPEENGIQKAAKRATTMLKGIVAGLPDAAQLVQQFNQLLPLILKLVGI